jgi:dTDP-4-dehydrorhamnose 3,5-epimerase-like enzyme
MLAVRDPEQAEDYRVSLAQKTSSSDNELPAFTWTMTAQIQTIELANFGDARGLSFTAPWEALAFVGRMSDVHVASTKPGAVRGNHYHLRRREAIVVMPGSRWSLHWDEGDQSSAQHRNFDGSKAVLILVSPGQSHAVRNDGDADMWLVAISSETYDPAESVVRKVV